MKISFYSFSVFAHHCPRCKPLSIISESTLEMQYLAKESFDYVLKRKYFVNFYSFFYSMAFPTDLDDVDQRIIWVALTVEYLHSVLCRDKHTNYGN